MAEPAISRSCLDCGRSRNDIDDAAPCPDCGSFKKNVAVTATASIRVTADSVAVGVTYAEQRQWQEQWRHMLSQLELLRGAYRPGADLGNLEMVRRADEFFVACWHVWDWLLNDPAVPQVTEAAKAPLLQQSRALAICNAYANTRKHMELSKPERLRARVVRYDSDQAGSRLTVGYWSSKQPQETVDALALAERCYSAWRQFMRDQGLGEPD